MVLGWDVVSIKEFARAIEILLKTRKHTGSLLRNVGKTYISSQMFSYGMADFVKKNFSFEE